MALALLALAAVPAAAYEFVGGATSGAEVSYSPNPGSFQSEGASTC